METAKLEKPQDTYWIVYILFYLLGLVHILPWTFFITAHDYWMYKFRNTSYEKVDSEHRTLLQREFSPGLTISLQLSTVSFLFLTLFFGHKYTIKLRLIGPLYVILAAFIFSAIFIHVDTDDWQTGFFALTMFMVAVINAMGSVCGMASYTVLANFPPEYLAAFINGQGMATIFTSCLEILSLAIGVTTKSSALIYFWLGIAVIGFCVYLTTVVSRRNLFYRYSVRNHKDFKKEKMMSFREMIKVLKQTWAPMAIMLFWFLTVIPVHTCITSLVVSEDEGNGSKWNDVYFVPVTTFFLNAICDYLGRTAAVKIKIDISGTWLTIFSAARIVIFIPLLMLCNAQPRQHLPVVFPHDYQYIIIMIIFSITNGYVLSISALIIPKLVPTEQLENALHVYMVGTGVLMGVLCFVGFVSVELI